MSYLGRKWGFAIESSGAGEVLDAPTAEFNIEVNPDVDETGAPLEAVDAEGNPTIDVVQTEIVEDQAEIEETADQVEKLEDTAEVLEHYVAAIEHRIRTNGGLTAGEYEFLMIGLESRVKNAGSLMPSVESMNSGRLAASREALDSIKEGIRKVWETIKRAVQSLYRKVKGWFVKTFDGAEMLRKRTEGVKTKNDKITGAVDDNSPLQLGGGDGAKLMDKDGKAISTGDALVKGLTTLKELASNYIKLYSSDEDAIIQNVAADIELITEEAKNAKNNGTMTIKSFSTQNKESKDNYKQLNANKTVLAEHKTNTDLDYGTVADNDMLGGKTLIVVKGLTKVAKSASDVDVFDKWRKDYENQRVMIKPYYSRLKEYNDGSSKVMTLSNINNACDLIIQICEIITGYRRNWLNRERMLDQVMKDVDSSVREVESDMSDTKITGLKSKVVGCIRSIGKRINNALNDQVAIISYLLSTCKAALSYCTRSQSRYKNN